MTRPNSVLLSAFVALDVVDATTHTEVLLALSAGSREEVDEPVDEALAAGGAKADDPTDYGSTYGWSFRDLDGHIWEVTSGK